MAKLLLDESPLIVLPSLAKEIGLNEAIVLQQLHYWLQNKKAAKQTKNFKQGRWWVYNTYRQWREDAFIFWSEITIQRIFLGLEKTGIVIGACLADDPKDRSKWYTIDYVKYQQLVEAKVEARQAERDAEFVGSLEDGLAEIPSDVLPRPEGSEGVDTGGETTNEAVNEPTLSTCDGASYQVDTIHHINLIPSIISSCDDAPHHSDAMYRTKTAAKISPKTATAERATPGQLPGATADETLDSAAAELIALLVEAEVNRADAKRLALEMPDECRKQLAFLPFVESFKSTKGAYLRTAIEMGFPPPKKWQEAQKRQEAGQQRVRQAQMNTAQIEADAARQAALEAEKARLQAECPEVWATLLAQAEAGLAAPIRSRPDGPAYKPALDAKINALVAAALPAFAKPGASVSLAGVA